jgi:N-acyl-D-amino-acid deacylase
VFRLIEQGKLALDDEVLSIVSLKPHLAAGARVDPRLARITVRHCLQHTAGWDRSRGFDPMSAAGAEETASALGIDLPIRPEQIVRYTFGKPLDFDPGSAQVYSNFGYCVLGRVIESVSGMSYGSFVTGEVLHPLGIERMRLARNLRKHRAPGEVEYRDTRGRTGRAISGPHIGRQVPLPYGSECLETMDASGGWIASAVDLMRFAAAFDAPSRCPLLKSASIEAMLGRPEGRPGLDENGRPAAAYYACGWSVRPNDGAAGRTTKWHGGGLAGSETFLLCRGDGTNWAVLFNADSNPQGKLLAGLIDPLLHRTADGIEAWPERDLFAKYYPRR